MTVAVGTGVQVCPRAAAAVCAAGARPPAVRPPLQVGGAAGRPSPSSSPLSPPRSGCNGRLARRREAVESGDGRASGRLLVCCACRKTVEAVAVGCPPPAPFFRVVTRPLPGGGGLPRVRTVSLGGGAGGLWLGGGPAARAVRRPPLTRGTVTVDDGAVDDAGDDARNKAGDAVRAVPRASRGGSASARALSFAPFSISVLSASADAARPPRRR